MWIANPLQTSSHVEAQLWHIYTQPASLHLGENVVDPWTNCVGTMWTESKCPCCVLCILNATLTKATTTISLLSRCIFFHFEIHTIWAAKIIFLPSWSRMFFHMQIDANLSESYCACRHNWQQKLKLVSCHQGVLTLFHLDNATMNFFVHLVALCLNLFDWNVYQGPSSVIAEVCSIQCAAYDSSLVMFSCIHPYTILDFIVLFFLLP